jgi:UDP-N-acetylmuramoyl-L-alanyl-D-glutamate--2,6-diaminopimelate ligase
MRLSKIMDRCGCNYQLRNVDPEITMISSDSRTINEGGLFIAIEGFKDNGIRYIEDAAKRGARAVVVEEKIKDRIKKYDSIIYCYTKHARKCALDASKAFYRDPSRSFQLAGVTGTNGKTTVTYLIEEILYQAGKNPGVIGTISYRYNDIVKKANNTTPDPIELQALFSKMKDSAVSHVIMEVSSHALALDRIDPQEYDYAVFTNLSQDHLDFHGTMEDYFKAKSLLFEGLRSDAIAVVNGDDVYGAKLPALTKARVVTYGLKPNGLKSDFLGNINNLSIDGTNFTIEGVRYESHLVGEHNVYNILAAYALAKVMDIDDEAIRRAITDIENIPGRFERVISGEDYHLFVDYAHTPDALDHLLDAANKLKKGRVITVFGCGGDRDRGKRPIMGSITERKSDIVIVTSDNPRSERPEDIIDDIKKGLKGSNHTIVPDRKEAIYKAVETAQKDDIVLIAGKGHEDYQILKEKTIHFDDREIALKAMKDLGK